MGLSGGGIESLVSLSRGGAAVFKTPKQLDRPRAIKRESLATTHARESKRMHAGSYLRCQKAAGVGRGPTPASSPTPSALMRTQISTKGAEEAPFKVKTVPPPSANPFIVININFYA